MVSACNNDVFNIRVFGVDIIYCVPIVFVLRMVVIAVYRDNRDTFKVIKASMIPFELNVRGYELSLRKADAEMIEIL